MTQLLKFNANVDDTFYYYASLNDSEADVLNALAEHNERSSQLNTVCSGNII